MHATKNRVRSAAVLTSVLGLAASSRAQFNGACCLSGGGCVITNNLACALQGTWHGSGSTCAASCPGACCLGDGSCLAITSGDCTAQSGVFHGYGSACADAGCPCTALTNGGFETGAFAPQWTQFGNTGSTGVNTGNWAGVTPHSGLYQSHFGPVGSTGGIARIITVPVGTPMTIDFWYLALAGFPNSFSADLGSTNLVSFTNDNAHGAWTEFTITVPAPSNNPVLSFTFRNDPFYDFLDDVRVCLAAGACCRADGTCFLTPVAGCVAASGIYRGDGANCATADCLCNIPNGGFETGAFAPEWTQFGNIGFSSVGTAVTNPGGIVPHTGTYNGYFGPVNTAGGIRRPITAAAGTPLTIDFWYQAQGGTAGANSFSADLGGIGLVSFTNDTTHTSWTEFTFNLPAPSNNPVLTFTFRNDPSYDYLDDVRVCIGQACYANCDLSTTGPCLNVLDFACFLNKFASGDSYANCDNSVTPPVLNVLDFACFLNKFAAGCSNC